MVTPQDIHNKFNENWSSKRGRTISTIGLLSTEPGVELRRNPHMEYFLHGGGKAGIPAPARDIALILNRIDALSYRAHTDCLDDARFRTLYGYQASVALPFIGPTGQAVSKPCEAYPCHYCGILIRKDLVQVDHRQPQALEAFAILKVLRAVFPGLTVSGPAGHITPFYKGPAPKWGAKPKIINPAPTHYRKSIQAPQIANATTPVLLNQLNPVHPKGWDVSTKWKFHNGTSTTKKDRYTLTESGQLALTAGIMLWGETKFSEACLNNLLNLVPSCAKCNNSKSKLVHAHK